MLFLVNRCIMYILSKYKLVHTEWNSKFITQKSVKVTAPGVSANVIHKATQILANPCISREPLQAIWFPFIYRLTFTRQKRWKQLVSS